MVVVYEDKTRLWREILKLTVNEHASKNTLFAHYGKNHNISLRIPTQPSTTPKDDIKFTELLKGDTIGKLGINWV